MFGRFIQWILPLKIQFSLGVLVYSQLCMYMHCLSSIQFNIQFNTILFRRRKWTEISFDQNLLSIKHKENSGVKWNHNVVHDTELNKACDFELAFKWRYLRDFRPNSVRQNGTFMQIIFLVLYDELSTLRLRSHCVWSMFRTCLQGTVSQAVSLHPGRKILLFACLKQLWNMLEANPDTSRRDGR